MFAIFIFVIFSLITHERVYATAACPSQVTGCSDIDYQGGCTAPCIRVVTQHGSPGPHGIQASCQCQMPNPTPGLVPVGGKCQRDSDCAAPGKYCYGGFAQAPTCHVELNPLTNPTPTQTKICDFAGTNKSDCNDCNDGTGKYSGQGQGAWTALGCIQTDPQKFIGSILGIAIGIGGGIAFLLILFGGFQILMSAGNPEKLNAGKELITSAITGLLIIIFSIFILQLIGVTIFAIPGFK